MQNELVRGVASVSATRNVRVACLLAALGGATVSLIGCGGTGNTGTTAVGAGSVADDTPLLNGGPCQNRYFQTIIGRYEGTVTYDAAAIDGSVCSWDMQLGVRGREFGTSICELTATIESELEQSVVQPASSPAASQCIVASERIDLVLGLPFDSPPVPNVDYTLPIRLRFTSSSDAPDRGPYFGDNTVSVRYIDLFNGNVPEVQFLDFDGRSVSIVERDTIVGTSLEGILQRTSNPELTTAEPPQR